MIAALCAVGLVGCGKQEPIGEVYYLNFKPEVELAWMEIAREYTDETGVPVNIVTSAGGEYDFTLEDEMQTKNPPTLFHVNGPMGLKKWQEYCVDLGDTTIYTALTDKELALHGKDGEVYGMPLTIEGYGIIYNEKILDKYFDLPQAKVESIDDVKSFEMLKLLVEDMQMNAEELEIVGVFSVTSLLPGEDWRWQTHLLNMPIYAEFKDKGITDSDVIEFTYNENFKNIFDLYINNSTTDPGLAKNRSVLDSITEFALGQVAMMQNGNWAWNQIKGARGNIVKEDDIKFLPIYVGLEGEENQGLVIGNENYLCVNVNATEEDKQATIDFLDWLVTSKNGKNAMVEKLGNIAPFNTFTRNERPSDPLAQSILEHMDKGEVAVPWVFQSFPSQNFKDAFGAKLTEYTLGTKSWEEIVDETIKLWTAEKILAGE